MDEEEGDFVDDKVVGRDIGVVVGTNSKSAADSANKLDPKEDRASGAEVEVDTAIGQTSYSDDKERPTQSRRGKGGGTSYRVR